MSKFTGTVHSVSNAPPVGWIEYDPEDESEEELIHFKWDPGRGEIPAFKEQVTFEREPNPNPDNPARWIATNVTRKT